MGVIRPSVPVLVVVVLVSAALRALLFRMTALMAPSSGRTVVSPAVMPGMGAPFAGAARSSVWEDASIVVLRGS